MATQVTEKRFPFMSCVLEVNVRGPKWQKILAAILSNIEGVNSFRMDDMGKVEVSGTVNPARLLKILGKAGQNAKICKWQFGQCSSYLFLPTNGYSNGGGGYSQSYYYYYYGGSSGGGRYGSGPNHLSRDQFAYKTIDNKNDTEEEDDTGLPLTGNGACCSVM